MRYFTFHIGDWLAGTRWLTPVQRAIYLDLLMQYYDQEGPLADEQCKCIASAYASAMQEDFDFVLHKYFEHRDDGWHNSRADEEIEAFLAKSEKRKRAASARWGKEKTTGTPADKASSQGAASDASAMQLHSKCSANGMLPNTQYPIPNKETTTARAKAARTSLACPDGIKPDAWDASNKIRKARRIGAWSEHAWELAVADGRKCGLSPTAMLDYCIAKGWASFRSEWYRPDAPAVESEEEHAARLERIRQEVFGRA